jgi:hypothetical protein
MPIIDLVDQRDTVVLSGPPPLLGYPLFPVATHKFIVLSLCTFGLYQFYWIYQNWKRLKRASGERLSPFWRVFFAPVWNFFLFRDIGDVAMEAGVPYGWSWHALALTWLVLSGLTQLPGPWGLIGFGSIAAIIPVQRTAQQVNDRYSQSAAESGNRSYGAANVAWILIGGLLLILSVIGTFMPPE